MKLSANFDDYEFTCHCGCGMGSETGKDGKEKPKLRLDVMDRNLIAGLQLLRDTVGPVVIVSGARCPRENLRVGGAKDSQHLYCRAADIALPKYSMVQTYQELIKIPQFVEGGIGIGNGIVHVDVRHNGPARWSYDKWGKTVPFRVPR
jgi:uncharacterized protein YcbK (DUF882 family)